jgi:hypothetical protein
MDAIERLLAVEEIKKLKARYFRYVDTHQWTAWGDLFVEDCTFTDLAFATTVRGREDLVRYVSDFLAEVTSIHHGHMPEIEILDEDTASGIWAMMDQLRYALRATSAPQQSTGTVWGYGHYVERYVRAGGQWKFKDVTLSRSHYEQTNLATAVDPRVSSA